MRPRFTRSDVRRDFAERAKRVENAILNNFRYLGEQCVNIGRSTNTYRDQTANLRNSIGYVIVRSGQVIEANFERTTTGSVTSPMSGITVGLELASQQASGYPVGYALIVVAGMNYAASVEARGLDVLTSAEQFAEAELPRMLKELKLDIATLR